jgi:hypothetical protein
LVAKAVPLLPRQKELKGERGHTPSLFWNVTPRTLSGVYSFGIALPLVCGFAAVPAAGDCAGVKYVVALEGSISTSGRAIVVVVFEGVRNEGTEECDVVAKNGDGIATRNSKVIYLRTPSSPPPHLFSILPTYCRN